jgi:hypothetical protein
LEDTQSGEECYIKGSNTKPSIKDMQLHDFWFEDPFENLGVLNIKQEVNLLTHL